MPRKRPCKLFKQNKAYLRQSSNFMTRSFGDRVAMNSPIQGRRADIMKIKQIKVDEALSHINERGGVSRCRLRWTHISARTWLEAK